MKAIRTSHKRLSARSIPEAQSRFPSTRVCSNFNIFRLFSSPRQEVMPLSERFPVDENLRGTVAVVTGANKGIGFETARGLAALGMETVVAARSEAAGLEAVDKIRAEFPAARVSWAPLEVTDSASRAAFAELLRERFGSVGILVNNAGFAYKGSVFGVKELQDTLAVNYYGLREVTEALLPLLSANARIVNVSSRAGSIRIIPSTEVRSKILNAASPDDLERVSREFADAIHSGAWKARGFPSTMYGFSKALVSRYTQILASQLASDPRRIVVSACCPGYVATQMSSFGGELTPEQGADCQIFLAVAPAEQIKQGAMYAERKEISYV